MDEHSGEHSGISRRQFFNLGFKVAAASALGGLVPGLSSGASKETVITPPAEPSHPVFKESSIVPEADGMIGEIRVIADDDILGAGEIQVALGMDNYIWIELNDNNVNQRGDITASNGHMDGTLFMSPGDTGYLREVLKFFLSKQMNSVMVACCKESHGDLTPDQNEFIVSFPIIERDGNFKRRLIATGIKEQTGIDAGGNRYERRTKPFLFDSKPIKLNALDVNAEGDQLLTEIMNGEG